MKMKATSCAICGTFENTKVVYHENIDSNSFTVKIFSARRIPDRKHYRIVRCNNCSLLRSDPINELKLDEIYSESSFDYSKEINGLKKTYYKLLKRNSKGKDFKSIFEIGGGNGFFLEIVLDNGYEKICGIEPSKNAISYSRDDIKPYMIPTIMSDKVLDKESFDVGVMFHTMDHLEDPLKTLKDAFNALKPGGIFLAAVHNERSWSAKLLRENSPIFDVEHTYLFNKVNGKTMFELAGFQDVSCHSYANSYTLNYLFQLLPYSSGLLQTINKNKLVSKLLKIELTLPLGNIYICGEKKKEMY